MAELKMDFAKMVEGFTKTAKEKGMFVGWWIPCSERLPEEDGFYLATCDGEICGKDGSFTGLAEYENGKWVDDEDDYQCVLAWMPLPEPYTESEE